MHLCANSRLGEGKVRGCFIQDSELLKISTKLSSQFIKETPWRDFSEPQLNQEDSDDDSTVSVSSDEFDFHVMHSNPEKAPIDDNFGEDLASLFQNLVERKSIRTP